MQSSSQSSGADRKIRLTVMGLSYSQIQTGVYALILAEADGPTRIPVVIGAAEAQSIALRMENITPTRPMTHDLFVSFAHAFGVKLTEVFIYKFEDGVFASELTFTDGDRTVVIDSRTSDAIAIAMRTHTPIFTTPEILEATGFVMEMQDGESDTASDSPTPTDDQPSGPKLENYAIEELERELAKLIEREDYEGAANVKRILDRKRGASDK